MGTAVLILLVCSWLGCVSGLICFEGTYLIGNQTIVRADVEPIDQHLVVCDPSEICVSHLNRFIRNGEEGGYITTGCEDPSFTATPIGQWDCHGEVEGNKDINYCTWSCEEVCCNSKETLFYEYGKRMTLLDVSKMKRTSKEEPKVYKDPHTEVLQVLCEHKYGRGWKGILRYDQKVSCMKVFMDKECQDYRQISAHCKEAGGQVAGIKNEKEQQFLEKLIKESRKNGTDEGGLIFLGARDHGGSFYWEEDGTAVVYGNWATKINSAPDMCIAVYADPREERFGQWAQISCSRQCEKNRGKDRSIGGICSIPLLKPIKQ